MIEIALIDAVNSVGIPAVMILWFMFRTEKVIKKNTEIMQYMATTIQKCNKK